MKHAAHITNLFRAILPAAAFLTAACTAPASSSPTDAPPNEASQDEVPLNAASPEDVKFEDVLAKYQAYNDRLLRVAAPLRLHNAHLCPDTERDPGFITHRLSDYPPALREIAKPLLGLTDTGVFIRTVRRDSPADAANIQAGDKLLKLGQFKVPQDGTSADKFYSALSKRAFASGKTQLTLRTPSGHVYSAQLSAQTACTAPMKVISSERINGHTDGQNVLITSALMRHVSDDTNLALIIAHEMGHIIAGHDAKQPSQLLELAADRMALVMMENAGYDIDAAIAYWQNAVHPHDQGRGGSATHPGTEARLLNFTTERARIRRQQALGQALTFQDIN